MRLPSKRLRDYLISDRCLGSRSGGEVMRQSLPVLIVSSNPFQREEIAEMARRCKLRPALAPSLGDARLILLEMHPLLIFCSDELSDSSLDQAIQTLRSESGVPVIALSRLAEWEPCVKALSAGAFDYIADPPDPKDTRRVLRLALGAFRREHPRQHAA
jgi:DNA-binding response OmpR family regulator